MTAPRLEEFLERLRQEFPHFVVVARPFEDPDEEGIEHFVHLLNVPEEALDSAAWRGLELAFEFYGSAKVPFHLTTITPKTSAEHFAKEIEESRWLHTPSLICTWTTTTVHDLMASEDWTRATSHFPESAIWWSEATTRHATFARNTRQLRTAGPNGPTAYSVLNHYSLAS